jgi:hypothetical protein
VRTRRRKSSHLEGEDWALRKLKELKKRTKDEDKFEDEDRESCDDTDNVYEV